jgi:thioesterase domain-containing protein
MDISIEALAAQYLEAIRTLQPHGPYFLGGYSMGGIVAFEMAQQLRAHSQEVALLAVFDTWGPGSQPALKERLQRLAYRFWRMPLHEKVSFLHAKAQWLAQSLREWRRIGILNHQAWRLQRLKKANIDAVHAYRPRPYAGVLTLFRACKQRTTATSDPDLGWRQLVTGAITVHEIPGDHYTMFASPHSRLLAERLQECLTHSQRSGNCTEHQGKSALAATLAAVLLASI